MLEILKRLSQVDASPYYVTSLYFGFTPEDLTKNQLYLKVKDLVKEYRRFVEEKLNWDKPVKESVLRDLDQILEFVKNPDNIAGGRGFAIFACDAKDLFEVVKLPYVYRNRLMNDRHPLIREILAIDEEFGRVGILLVDRHHIRFFIADITGVKEVADFVEPVLVRAHKFHSGGTFLKGAEGERRLTMPSRVAAPNVVRHGVGEWRFQQRIKHDWHAALKLAADAVFEYWKEHPFDHLVVGSLPGEPVEEIENVLHDYLRRILLGYIEINPAEADEVEVWNKLLDFRIRKDREEEKNLIAQFKEEIGWGTAVNGWEKTLEMLNMGNVRTLIVNEDFSSPGYICRGTNTLTLQPECPAETDRLEPVFDIVDEMIEEALHQRAKVEVIVDRELQKEIDGVAALLRFRL
ncbi:MAG TPA: peptide chain release factor 1 [Aquificales bacterium]|nr:peptide chain release factor 1 [Aquificales bacterium]